MIAGAGITTQRWHCWPNQDGGYSQETVLLRPGFCYLWRYTFFCKCLSVLKPLSRCTSTLRWALRHRGGAAAASGPCPHPHWSVMFYRCQWAVWLWPHGLCPEEQHPAGVEAALHPGGADPGDRLHDADARACPQVSVFISKAVVVGNVTRERLVVPRVSLLQSADLWVFVNRRT